MIAVTKSQITRVEIPCDGCGQGYLVPIADSEADLASLGRISVRVEVNAMAVITAQEEHLRRYAAEFDEPHPRTLVDEMNEPLIDDTELISGSNRIGSLTEIRRLLDNLEDS